MAHRRWLWYLVLFMLPALACNAFAGANGEPTLPSPPTTTSETAPPAEGTPDPNGEQPEIAPTPTLPGDGDGSGDEEEPSGTPAVQVLVDLNVRNGPSVQYDRIGFLLEGTSVPILGVDPASGWWKIECPANISSPECWISGGTQYSEASNAANVSVAVAPPTPTPAPVVLDENTGLLAFVDNGRLSATQLDLTQNPPVPKETTQLDNSPDVQAVAVSPDGTAVAYIVQVVGGNELRLVNIDGRNRRTLVRSEELPFVGSATELPDIAQEGDPNLSVQILQMAWVSDNTLAFNTGIINSAGFSPGAHSDLWTVTTAGDRQERVAAGDGGPVFTISANNQVLFSRQDAIVRAGVDGSNLEIVLTFEPVGISEAFYYPRPQWSADGTVAYVAVSDQIFDNGAQVSEPTATIWTIPTSGVAEKAGSIIANVIFDPITWSGDGQRLTFLRRTLNSNDSDLVIANGVGLNDVPYIKEPEVRSFGWHNDNERFLYATANFYAVGKLGDSSVRFPLDGNQRVSAGEWVAGDWFITAVSNGSSVEYRLGNASGDISSIAQAGGFVPYFDIWVP
ncbi:MAG: SH3 domain-containing protein [Chloroflexota bacterium]